MWAPFCEIYGPDVELEKQEDKVELSNENKDNKK